MEGDLYVDGSCSKGLVPELSRASWSVAMVGKEGKLQARVSGPIWNTLPQTPQAAEFVASQWQLSLHKAPPSSTMTARMW
eukprot:13813308-Heterocapsa_arctica.AAC.1